MVDVVRGCGGGLVWVYCGATQLATRFPVCSGMGGGMTQVPGGSEHLVTRMFVSVWVIQCLNVFYSWIEYSYKSYSSY